MDEDIVYKCYQLVEKSTYTTATAAVIKSLMPITIKRVAVIHEDVDGNRYLMPLFRTFVFRRETDVMLFIISQFGIAYSFVYMQVHNIMKLLPDCKERRDDCLYFQISSKCYLEVNQEMFEKYQYVQAIAAGYLEVLNTRFDLANIEDREPFIKKLSPSNTYDKGLDTLTSFNRMLDETTRKILKVNKYHKEDVYSIIRWAMFEFNQLRMKDNMNLENKRLRCHEYIASLLTQEFSIRLNRVINLGTKATMENVIDIFKFPGTILIQHFRVRLNLSKCGELPINLTY